MGSEILDSSGGARTVAPELVETRAAAEPMLELDELQPVTIEPARPPRPRSRPRWPRLPVLAAVRRLRDDEPTRRTAIRTVLACLVVMALTASVVQFRASRQVRAERDGRAAVDIRVTAIRQGDTADAAATAGLVTADLQVHNLGPARITVVALDIMNGGDATDVVIANDVAKQSQPVDPGLNREASYTMQLPCRPSFQLGFGPPQMIAKVRTVDGALHSLPVNLDTINEQGGLLTACVRDDSDQTSFNYGSVTDGRSVTITIDVTSEPAMINMMSSDVGVPVQYVTAPRLPALARPGSTFVLKITPRVTACPDRPLDPDALQNVGVSVGTQLMTDASLSILVAQAAGRACGARS